MGPGGTGYSVLGTGIRIGELNLDTQHETAAENYGGGERVADCVAGCEFVCAASHRPDAPARDVYKRQDYYDVFPRPGKTIEESRVVFAVADVAGKSIPAAMLMATFQASLKTLSTAQVPLEELVANMNKYACSNSQGGLRFTTAFLAEYDAARRVFHYINAGHNLSLIHI